MESKPREDQPGRHYEQALTHCELHVCPTCGSELVYPLEWTPAGSAHWEVRLRCPDCEWRGQGTYAQPVLDEFDQQLDLGTEALIDDLKALTRSNVEDEVAAFSRALEVGLILPEDF